MTSQAQPAPEQAAKKRCTICSKWLPLSAFGKSKLGKYGVRSRCKVCVNRKQNERKAERRKADPAGYAASLSPRGRLALFIRDEEEEFRSRGTPRKRCCRCEKWLPVDLFTKDKNRKGGFYPVCIPCRRVEYDKNREKILEQKAGYRTENQETIRKSKSKDYLKNREKILEERRESYSREPESARKKYRDRRKVNLKHYRELGTRARHRRRARMASVPCTLTIDQWNDLVSRSPHCHWCKKPWTEKRQPTHDHVVPVSKGGPDTLENSCCACMSCNRHKRASLFCPVTGQGILL